MKRNFFCFCLLAALFAALTLPAAAQGYHVVKKIDLGGDGCWDYLTVDSATHRLFIARATRVMVVDLDAGKLLGEIADVTGAHGVALAHEFKRGFASAGRSGDVLMFDLESLKPLGRIKAGENPDAILYDGASKRVFVFNGRSKDATVMDARDGAVAGTIPLGGKPEFSVSDEKGRVFVNIEDTGEVAVIDAKKMTVEKRWPLKPCEEPSGLALDKKNRRLFSVCGNK